MPDATRCDYVDVAIQEKDQPLFYIQPHLSGGTPFGQPFVLEIEGARALWSKLNALLVERGLVSWEAPRS